ncbi:Holliday junction resolvase RecU [Desulfuribacillus stibiiarsenatis]|nr:Holliday junction resolvase RecU [Desulfuribacillus stibiiarsenatis]
MSFEALIEYTNKLYEQTGRAIVTKRPTPVKVLKLVNGRIKDGWFEKPSTVDYEGTFQGRSVNFEAKSTKELTRFDLKNIHDHQVQHLKKCHEHGGISFILVEFRTQRKTFLMQYETFAGYWSRRVRGGTKSISFDEFEHTAYEVPRGKVPVDYLSVVQKIWELREVS